MRIYPKFDYGRPRGGKLKCRVCRREGYSGGSWMDACRRGHRYRCKCGRRYPSLQAISAHISPRRWKNPVRADLHGRIAG